MSPITSLSKGVYSVGGPLLVGRGKSVQDDAATTSLGPAGGNTTNRANESARLRTSRTIAGFSGACLLLLILSPPVPALSKTLEESLAPGSSIDLKALASSFTENMGQVGDRDLRFLAASDAMQVGFAESSVLIKLVERSRSDAAGMTIGDRIRRPPPHPAPSSSVLMRLDFEGANRVIPQGRGLLPYPTNFFFGDDPAGWRTGVRSFREIVYEDLYDGIDLVYRMGPDGLKYDFLVHSAADLARIRMVYDGITSLSVSAERLVLRTAAGEVRDEGLVATAGGNPVRCAFARLGLLAVGFVCEGWDRTQTLVIDPLVWATFLGGGREEEAMAVALDSSGNPILAGWTYSTDFPVTAGAHDATFNGGYTDAFVAKLSADGSSLLWATFVGGGVGDGNDGVFSLALDVSGNAILGGDTYSSDFPTTPGAYDTTHNGAADAFVAKLSADGSSLLWSTYLGGGDADHGWTLAENGASDLLVGGETRSTDFPATSGAYDVTLNGLEDAFVASLSGDGSTLRWATFLGGSGPGEDEAYAFALDSSGNPVVAGVTYSPDFPSTPGAFDATYSGGFTDAFVAKLSADGSALLWSTFLGGGVGDGDQAWALARDGSGNFVVAGRTLSSDFPVTAGAYDVTYNGFGDAFVATLSADGSALLWSTFLGGGEDESLSKFVLDGSGDLVMAGVTQSTDFPTTPDAVDVTFNGFVDAFVAKLGGDGSSLLWASFLGGVDAEGANDLALDAVGNPVVIGRADSTDFPVTAGAFDVTKNGSYEAFAAKLNLAAGPLPPTVTITSPADGMWFSTASVTTSGTAGDGGSGLDRVEVSCDGGTSWSLAAGTASWIYACAALTEGSNPVRARAFDLVGRESAHGTLTVNVDLTPPTVTIVCVPSGGEVGTAVTCLLEVSDNLDPSPTVSWRVTTEGSVIASGNGTRAHFIPNRIALYSVEATGKDAAEHMATDSATVMTSERFLVSFSLFVVLPVAIGLLVFLLARRKKRRGAAKVAPAPTTPSLPPSPPP